jgi:hypothetical protein
MKIDNSYLLLEGKAKQTEGAGTGEYISSSGTGRGGREQQVRRKSGGVVDALLGADTECRNCHLWSVSLY